jgi:hypothetical protein
VSEESMTDRTASAASRRLHARAGLALLAVTVAVTLAVSVPLVAAWREQRARYAAGAIQISELEHRLAYDTTPEDVRRWLLTPEFAGLQARPDLVGWARGDADLAISSPATLDAKNWVLHLRFDNARLKFARVGTVDSLDEHPPEAPVARSFEAPRP